MLQAVIVRRETCAQLQHFLYMGIVLHVFLPHVLLPSQVDQQWCNDLDMGKSPLPAIHARTKSTLA